tara:strand:+ start:1313 stop:1471 length:159 start_codon:yes stop_codon:yes gene_type:complete
LFSYCTVKEKKCPFAGKYQGNVHCGLEKGGILETRVDNIRKCPWKPKKRGKF